MGRSSGFFGRIFWVHPRKAIWQPQSTHFEENTHRCKINRRGWGRRRPSKWGHSAASRVGSLCGGFMGKRPIWKCFWRLCLKMQHHVRTISTDGSCLFPHSIMRTQRQWFPAALLALGNPLPQSREDLSFPLAQCLVVCIPPSRPSPGTK